MSKRFILNGIFGVMKEAGDSVDDYRQWIRLTHYHGLVANLSSLGFYLIGFPTDQRVKYMPRASPGTLRLLQWT